MTAHDVMRDRLLRRAGLIPPVPTISLKEMEALQWGSEWQDVLGLMKNRMVMGGYRYGPYRDQKKGQYDNISDVRRRLKLYEQTGNMEHLVDAANITILECMVKSHPKFHFNSIDDGEHAKAV